MERLDLFFNYVLDQSVQIGVLVVAVACLSFVLRHRSAHVRYLLWLVVLAKCLVPPVTSVSVPLIKLPAGEVVSQMASNEVPAAGVVPVDVSQHTESLTKATAPTIPVTRIHWNGALVWLIGCAAFLVLALGKVFTLTWRLRQERKPLGHQQQAMVQQLVRDMGVTKLPRLWQIDGLGQPFVWGFPRGMIYVPADLWEGHSESHIRCALAHELIHVMRWDALVNTLQIVAQAIFWFHPLVWWANHRLRHERERCCDEATIALLNTPSEIYGEAIIETLVSAKRGIQLQSSLAIAGPLRGIEKRLKNIMKPNKRFHQHAGRMNMICIVLVALAVVPTAWRPTRARATEAHDIKPVDEVPRQVLIKAAFYSVNKSVADLDVPKQVDISVNEAYINKLNELARQDKDVQCISKPMILTQVGETAEISVGNEVPGYPSVTADPQGHGREEWERRQTGLKMSIVPTLKPDTSLVRLQIKADLSNVVVSKDLNQEDVPLRVSGGIETSVSVESGTKLIIRGLPASSDLSRYIVAVISPILNGNVESSAPEKPSAPLSLVGRGRRANPRQTLATHPIVTRPTMGPVERLIKRTEFIQNDLMVKALMQKQIELEMELMDQGDALTSNNPASRILQLKLETISKRLDQQKNMVGQQFDRAWEEEQRQGQ